MNSKELRFSHRPLLLFTIGIALTLTVAVWAGYYLRLKEVLDFHGANLDDVIPYSDAEFGEAARRAVIRGLNPIRVLAVAPLGFWLVVAGVGVCGLSWGKNIVDPALPTDLFLGLPVALPMLAGLAYQPIGLHQTFQAIASIGVSSPALFGVGIGETLSCAALGSASTLLCGLLFAFLHSRSPGRRSGEPPPEGPA